MLVTVAVMRNEIGKNQDLAMMTAVTDEVVDQSLFSIAKSAHVEELDMGPGRMGHGEDQFSALDTRCVDCVVAHFGFFRIRTTGFPV